MARKIAKRAILLRHIHWHSRQVQEEWPRATTEVSHTNHGDDGGVKHDIFVLSPMWVQHLGQTNTSSTTKIRNGIVYIYTNNIYIYIIYACIHIVHMFLYTCFYIHIYILYILYRYLYTTYIYIYIYL